MRLLILSLWALVVAAAPAVAAPEPIYAPIPDWVEAVEIPEPNPALRDRHVQSLLISGQSLFGTEQVEHHAELALLVQTTQGLQGSGNIILPWQPDQSDLIIHKVRILRGSTVIDLLEQGHEFTVLRRESNLETAILDGTLTAVMQAEGLEVGDILNVAFTVRRRPGTLGLRGENFVALAQGTPVGRFHVRQVWPDTLPIRWRGSDLLANPVVRRTDSGTELVVDLRNVEGPKPPEQAPPRFALPATLQITGFRDWAEMSALVAPHYDRASSLAAESPLRAEIARIAALSDDPRQRAMAALRLVQEQMRYFALVMGDGGYLPATADETWMRRYGDCKAKTVTLLALLHGLGIESEAVLVNSRFGDALPERLPQMAMFDHVIVRARIDGQSYWLDGTRTGDRDLDELASSAFGWGLPIRPGGAQLEEIPFAPPRQPLVELNVVFDASGGLGGRIPISMDVVYRGDMAVLMRQAIAQVGREEFLRGMREDIEIPGEENEIESIDFRDTDSSGAFAIIVTGTSELNWTRIPGNGAYQLRFSNETIAWDAEFDRPEGQGQDAPFALPVPVHISATETVILPNGGVGFSLDGTDFDRVVAATRIGRTLQLADGRAVARSYFVRLAREIPAQEARDSLDQIRLIADDAASIVAPASALAGVNDDGTSRNANLSASELVDSGFANLDSDLLEEALADFDRAIALAPDWGRPRAGRGVTLLAMGRTTEGEAALADAIRRDQADFVIHQAFGNHHMVSGRPTDAVASFSRALELEPGSRFALMGRAEAQASLGRFPEALADLDARIEAQPSDTSAQMMKTRIHLVRGEEEDAIATIERALEASPNDLALIALQARTLRRLGRTEAAAAAYARAFAAVDAEPAADEEARIGVVELRSALVAESGDPSRAVEMLSEAIQQHPDHAGLLNSRCWTRAISGIEFEEALADCERAVAADPQNAAILDSRAFVKLQLGRVEEAIADADAALAISPTLPASLYVRGVARLRQGDREAGEEDLAAARLAVFDIDLAYRDYGLTP